MEIIAASKILSLILIYRRLIDLLLIATGLTLGHTLHTLPQHWPTECHRYIFKHWTECHINIICFARLQRLKVQGKVNPVSPICVQIARFDTFKMRAVHTPNDHFACI